MGFLKSKEHIFIFWQPFSILIFYLVTESRRVFRYKITLTAFFRLTHTFYIYFLLPFLIISKSANHDEKVICKFN